MKKNPAAVARESEHAAAGRRWRQRPPGSNWGDFGQDDQAGRLNLLTAQKVKEGMAEVLEGRTFCLSLPLDRPGGTSMNPHRLPPVIRPGLRNHQPYFLYRMKQENPAYTDVLNDDLVTLHLQYSTQWDSLAHVGSLFDSNGDGVLEPVFYNGHRGGADIVGPLDVAGAGVPVAQGFESTSHARRLGVEQLAERCMQGRAVMLDVQAHFGSETQAIGYDRLMKIIDADRVDVRPGDMVCVHTGFSQRVLDMNGELDVPFLRAHEPGLDGRDDKLLDWISDSGIACVIADNEAVERKTPSNAPNHAYLPLHEHCLFKLGVPLAELWLLSPLAQWLRENRRTAFLLTAPPLRLPGAVGSPVTPVATV